MFAMVSGEFHEFIKNPPFLGSVSQVIALN